MRCKWQEDIWFYNNGYEDVKYEWCEGEIITYVGVGSEVHAVISDEGKLFHIDISRLTIL